MDKPETFTATVLFVTRMAGAYYVARFALVQPSEIRFFAGQYVIFKIGPPKVNHTLSIASSPANKEWFEVLQSIAPMGEGSKWLLGLKPGQIVQFMGPLGKFTLQKDSGRPKVFVATGCGIAPIRAMIMDQLSVFRYQFSVTLYWGLRYETDVFWQSEFDGLAKKYPNFRWTITLSKPTDAWAGVKGRVTAYVVQETPELGNSEFYLCGSRAMIVEIRDQLAKSGVPPEHIITETFF